MALKINKHVYIINIFFVDFIVSNQRPLKKLVVVFLFFFLANKSYIFVRKGGVR